MHILKLFRLVKFVKDFTIDDVVVFRSGDVKLVVNFGVVDRNFDRSWEIVSDAFPQTPVTFDVHMFREHDYLADDDENPNEQVEAIRNHPRFENLCRVIYEHLGTREFHIQNKIREMKLELAQLENIVNDIQVVKKNVEYCK